MNNFESLLSFFTPKNILEFLQFVIPIIATYLITKYTTNSPIRKEVNSQQFEKVYLPLYKLFCINKPSPEEITERANQMNTILLANYELVFPNLHSLSNELLVLLNSDKDYNDKLIEVCYEISIDYEILKKKLGYPHLNQYDLFIRKTPIDKIRFLFGWLITICIFCGVPLVSNSATKGNFSIVILYFVLLFVGLIAYSRIGTRNV